MYELHINNNIVCSFPVSLDCASEMMHGFAPIENISRI